MVFVKELSTEERFLNHVEKTKTCWLWASTINPQNGYGRFRVGSRSDETRRIALAHRLAHRLWVGPIPEGHHVDHLCAVRHCVNPDHLEAVTPAENRARQRNANAEKTHCKWGHEFDEANTYHTKDGKRSCRACHRIREAKRRAA